MAEADKEPQKVMQPGQVITPGSAPGASPAPSPPSPEPVPAQEKPVEAPTPPAPPSPQPTVANTDHQALLEDEAGITWTASEFVAHEKTSGWYFMLAAAALLASLAIFVLTHDVVSSIVILVAAAVLGMYASREPRQLVYKLGDAGLMIGDKHFPYEMFRSFSVVPEGAFSSIVLLPLRRFSPLITIYFAPDDEEIIAAVLSERLPYAEFRYDAVDRLMRRIRF